MKTKLLEEKVSELIDALQQGNLPVGLWISEKLLRYIQEDKFFNAEPEPTVKKSTYPKTMAAKEEQIIKEALERNAGFRKETADELGMSERTLYRKLKKYGLDE